MFSSTAWPASSARPAPTRRPRGRRGGHRQDPARPGAGAPGAPARVVLAGQADPAPWAGRWSCSSTRSCGASTATASRGADAGRQRDDEPPGRGAGPGRRRPGPEAQPPATGLVVVFEDLHWADSESLTVFERLAEPERRPPAGGRHLPARRAVPPPPGRRPAAPARAAPHGHPHPARPAEPGGGQRLPRRRVRRGAVVPGGRRPAHPHRRATRSSSRSWWPAPGTCPADDLDDMPLPWTVAELVRSQLDDLDPDVREIGHRRRGARAARVPFDLLAAVTGTSRTT